MTSSETQHGSGRSPIRVLAAVVERDGRYLVARRPRHKRHGGLWEFPGGKLESGETLLDAARRELREELAVEVLAVGELMMAVRDPGSSYLVEFTQVTISGEPALIEHEDLAWLEPEELGGIALAPTDARFARSLTRA